MPMQWTYVRTPGRGIDVDLGVDHPGWNETLADSISSMPPKGSPDHGLSTYWIDHVLTALRSDAPEGRALSFGNSTEIVMGHGLVLARSLYETFNEEEMDAGAFEHLLVGWRAEVTVHGNEFHIEETYRRNGYDPTP